MKKESIPLLKSLESRQWTAREKVGILAKTGERIPVILNIGAYRFFFYSNEGNPTKAPHIHVRRQNGEATISLVEPYAVMLNAGFQHRSCANLQARPEKREILKGAYHDYFA